MRHIFGMVALWAFMMAAVSALLAVELVIRWWPVFVVLAAVAAAGSWAWRRRSPVRHLQVRPPQDPDGAARLRVQLDNAREEIARLRDELAAAAASPPDVAERLPVRRDDFWHVPDRERLLRDQLGGVHELRSDR